MSNGRESPSTPNSEANAAAGASIAPRELSGVEIARGWISLLEPDACLIPPPTITRKQLLTVARVLVVLHEFAEKYATHTDLYGRPSIEPVSEKHDIFDLIEHLRRQREFSERTFGPGRRTAGVLAHIRKELKEIETEPLDVFEWIDVVLLALDGAWRAGHSPEAIAQALVTKQAKNEARNWPDWRTASEDGPIEHRRSANPYDCSGGGAKEYPGE